MLVDYTKMDAETYSPVCISGTEVEKVNRFRVLGITITENLQYVGHHTSPPWLRKDRKGATSYRNLGGLNCDFGKLLQRNNVILLLLLLPFEFVILIYLFYSFIFFILFIFIIISFRILLVSIYLAINAIYIICPLQFYSMFYSTSLCCVLSKHFENCLFKKCCINKVYYYHIINRNHPDQKHHKLA